MSSLQYPLPHQVRISQGFGAVMAPTFTAHNGVDLAATCGTPILAAGAGVVSKVITGAAALANIGGREIHIRHSDQVTTIYAHASAVYVRQGQTVAAGTPIGAVGASGLATGCHLHFQLDVNGKAVDPGPSIGIGPTGKGPASAVSVDNTGQATLASSGTKDYGPVYPLLESEVKTWAASGADPCAPGYRLGSVDPRLNYILDNPAGSGPKGAHWVQAPLLTEHPDWAAKGGDSTFSGDGRRFACVRQDIQPGNVNQQQLFRFVLPALLEPGLNLAILGFAGVLIFLGIKEIASATG